MAKTLLLFVSEPADAERELRARGGRIAVRLPGGLVVARVPDSFELQDAKGVQLADEATLDETGARARRAFHESRRILASTPKGHGLKWNAPGYSAPRFFSASQEEETKRSSFTPTSLVMNRGIAVGVVVISGPSSDLKFSEDDIDKVYSECLAALDFLSGANPEARIHFTIEMTPVTITAKPLDQSCGGSSEPCESVFRDPALAILGYTPSAAGSGEYARHLQSEVATSWGYVAYFTKYPVYYFAYAGGPRVVIQYSNDNWGPDNIHRVFAHESCHIFGAADEYSTDEKNCVCGELYGYLQAPNDNCDQCPGEHFDCLMGETKLVLCTWSRRQIGWNAWSEQTDVTKANTAQTSSSPALAAFGGSVWMAYKGEAEETLYACSYDGTTWSAQTTITTQNDAQSSTGPALATYDDKLWMAFKGKGSENLYGCSFDGTTWNSLIRITDQNGAQTSDTPALAEYNGRLWMAFRHATSPNLRVCSFDGTTWGEQTDLKDVNDARTSSSPALASFGGKLWLLFRGADSPNLRCCTFDGSSWSAQTLITDINDAKTSQGPRAGVVGDSLWLVYRGESSSNIWSCSYDGTTWLEQTEITTQNGAESSTSIGVAPLSDKLVAAFRGKSSDTLHSIELLPDADVNA